MATRSPALAHLLFYSGPVLLCLAASALLVGSAQLLFAGGGLWPIVFGLALTPLATSVHGVATTVAMLQIRRDRSLSEARRAFWTAALAASGGLLTAVWWWMRPGPSAKVARTVPGGPHAPVFAKLPMSHIPTVVHAQPVARAPRTPARLDVVRGPIDRTPGSPLAPTVHLRRRRVPVGSSKG